MQDLKWRCHICGEERPDEKISVHKSAKVLMGGVSMQRNVRYCNDRPACIEAAPAHDFFKGKE